VKRRNSNSDTNGEQDGCEKQQNSSIHENWIYLRLEELGKGVVTKNLQWKMWRKGNLWSTSDLWLGNIDWTLSSCPLFLPLLTIN
jgi:hypothetical protein